MEKNILLLEDDKDLAYTIEELLKDALYNVDVVFNIEQALEATYNKKYDLYIFDINLPDGSGLEFLEELKTFQDTTPVIFISALVDLNTIAKAFSIGAQDYIKKPFFPEELLIRVNAKLAIQDKIIFKNITFDKNQNIVYKNNKQVFLTQLQLCLIKHFFFNFDRIIEKSTLFECFSHPSDTALRVALSKLKQILDIDIKNIRGVGYILEKD